MKLSSLNGRGPLNFSPLIHFAHAIKLAQYIIEMSTAFASSLCPISAVVQSDSKHRDNRCRTITPKIIHRDKEDSDFVLTTRQRHVNT